MTGRAPFAFMKSTLSLSLLLVVTSAAMGRPKTFQPAVSILGQPNFTSAIENIPPTSRSFFQPEGVAIDPTTGKLFVADSDNNRILRFSATAAYQTNPEAEAVFGQPDFVSAEANRGNGPGSPAADSLHYPAAIWIDGDGRLWVPDLENSRVLRFDNASSKPSFTATADGVIGQADFTSATAATNSDDFVTNGLFSDPAAVTVDADGNLWVSDPSLFRVLRFDGAANLGVTYVGAPDGYLGEVAANVFVSGTSPATFSGYIWGVCIGVDGRLWVADWSNNRVLRFDDAVNKANGAAADGVLGQSDFVTGTATDPPTATGFEGPYGVTTDSDGTLWVGDYINYRVLGFLDAANKANGGPADIVLGQPDFVTQDLPPTYLATSATNPSQIAIGREGSLFIGEYSNAPHIKRWSDPVTLTTPRTLVTKRTSATLRGRSSGAIRVQYKVAGQGGFRTARGSAANWNARLAKLKKKTTPVTVRATAFDNRSASGLTRVKLKVPKSKK